VDRVEIRMLGGFAVVVDSHPVPEDAWPQRRAVDLVKVLALAPGHRLARDQVLEALWPSLGGDAGAANLHKAASYARRALGDRRAIVLRGGHVELAPDSDVITDIERFEAGDGDAYAGELLPDDRYEEWTSEPRERLRARRVAALRARGAWEELAREDPLDEQAQRELARAEARTGEVAAAIRRIRRLKEQLAAAGAPVSPETLELERCMARGPAVMAPRLFYTPLAGRERELASAAMVLRHASEERGGALLVSGGAGMGKSRMVEALLEQAEALGFHTLRGGAHEEEGRAPYAPVVEAVDPLVRERPDLASSLSVSARRALSLVLPSAPPSDVHGGWTGVERHRMFSAAGQLLTSAAAERPVALALDDLHAADEATVGVVHYLARIARGVPLLVIVAFRDERPPDRVARLRSSLIEQRAAVELRLGPLDRTAVAAVAERVAGRPLAERSVRAIERTAAGNPFFVEELAAGVDAAGEITFPDRLNQVLDARLGRLEPLAGGLRAPLAVLEDGFTTTELAGISGRDEEEVAHALESACWAGVLEEARGGYRFRHPLVREALLARLSQEDLERAHREAAARLAADGAPPERVAHHLLHAGRADEAVPMLAEAAEWAAHVGAHRDGLEWVERGLAHAEGEQRRRLLELRAQFLDRTGDPRAPTAYSEAIALAEGRDAIELRLMKARACIAGGDVEGARETLEALDVHDPGDRGRAALWWGMVGWFEGDVDASRRASEEAAPLLEAAGLSEDLAMLDDLQAMLAHASGSWGSHSTWRLRETAHLPELAARVFDAYLCVTEYVLNSGEPYAQLAAFAKRLRAQARQTGARRGEAFAVTLLGETELFTGNLTAARDHLIEAAALSREVGATGGEALARMRLGEALLHLGDRHGAGAQLEEALELSQASTLARHLLYLVHAAMVQVPADPAARLPVVDRAETLLSGQRMCAYCPTGFYVEAAIACAAGGAVERGRRFLERAAQGAALWPPGPWHAALAEARAHLLLAEGARDEGAAALRRAAEGFAAAGQLLGERRARKTLAGLSRA
jgi:DNA-binding SARP family transcriptional activator/tetratricopeptide (TPR) repeat protein